MQSIASGTSLEGRASVAMKIPAGIALDQLSAAAAALNLAASA
jgi:hypothetical protein